MTFLPSMDRAVRICTKNMLVDLSSLVSEVEKKHGKVHQIGRQIAYNEGTKVWSALPTYYISFPGLYRKDLWDEIGMKPDTWEDIRVGGAKLKAKGTPIGIGLGHSVDPNRLVPQHAVELWRV